MKIKRRVVLSEEEIETVRKMILLADQITDELLPNECYGSIFETLIECTDYGAFNEFTI